MSEAGSSDQHLQSVIVAKKVHPKAEFGKAAQHRTDSTVFSKHMVPKYYASFKNRLCKSLNTTYL